jgi:signal transduction histidine kinase
MNPTPRDPAAPAETGADDDPVRILTRLMQATAGTTGQAYFDRVVRGVAREFGVHLVYVGQVTPRGDRIRSRAVAREGEAGAPFSYPLAGTPCQDVLGHAPVFIPAGVADLYPEDDLLRELGAEGYLGHPLLDTEGHRRGVMVVVHDRPLPRNGLLHGVLGIVAQQAGAELGREQAEAARRATGDRAEKLVRERSRLALNPSLRSGDVAGFATDAAAALARTLGLAKVGVWLADRRDPTLLRLRHGAPTEIDVVPLGSTLRVDPDRFPPGVRLRVTRPEATDEESGSGPLSSADPTPSWYAEAAVRLGGELNGLLSLVPPAGAPDLTEMERGFVADVADLVAHALLDARTREHRSEAVRLARLLGARRSLEELGSLAGGIAHDMGNVLTAILGALEELPPQDDADARECVDDIRSAGEHGRELVTQIKQFARSGMLTLERVDVPSLLRQVAGELRRRLPGGVRVDLHIAATALDAEADPTQLRQAIFNLADNAAVAMEGAGVLRLELVRLSPEREIPAADPDAIRDGYRIVLADDGPGIEAGILERMWEPFFTTRQARGGTGLGLAIVGRVIRAHGGSIRVDTDEGVGSTFRLDLPRRASARPQPPAAPADGVSERTVG